MTLNSGFDLTVVAVDSPKALIRANHHSKKSSYLLHHIEFIHLFCIILIIFCMCYPQKIPISIKRILFA